MQGNPDHSFVMDSLVKKQQKIEFTKSYEKVVHDFMT